MIQDRKEPIIMPKSFNFICVNGNSPIVSVRDDVQFASVKLPENKWQCLLNIDGLEEIPYQTSLYFKFPDDEPSITFLRLKFLNSVNSVNQY